MTEDVSEQIIYIYMNISIYITKSDCTGLVAQSVLLDAQNLLKLSGRFGN